MSKLQLVAEGDTHVIVTRRFAAPPAAVFRAHTEAELLQQWCLGPVGWSMPVCICEPYAGGQIRYEWRGPDGAGFFLTGEFIEVDAPHRIVHVERMFLPDATPDNHVETRFDADGDGTVVTMRMTLPDEATRTAMLGSGMEYGMEASFERLEQVLASSSNTK